MTSFFSRPAADAEPQPERRMLSGCKPEEQKLPRRQHDDDDDDDADSNESNPRTDPGAGFASSTTKAGAAQGSGSKAGTADMVTKAQLQGAARLLKACPYSHGLEASVMHSDPQLPTRRKLFTAVYRAIKDMSNQNVAKAAVEWVIHRFSCYIVAGCVSEAELTLGPRFRAFVRENCLPGLLALGFTEVRLIPINDALAAAGLSSPQDVRASSSANSAEDDEILELDNIIMPRMAGASFLLQRALETCCVCWSASGNACRSGHLRICEACSLSFSVKHGQCVCLTVAVSLMKNIDRQGDTTAVLKRLTLMDGSGLLAKAAKLLVLAVMMDLVPVIDALLNRVLYV
jgi:hypothetical protein